MLVPVGDLIKQVKQNIRCIDAQTAASERKANKGLLVDVREPAEHQTKPAFGAINIPRGVRRPTMSCRPLDRRSNVVKYLVI